MTDNNPLASYFQNNSDLNKRDVPGSTFFDIIGQTTSKYFYLFFI